MQRWVTIDTGTHGDVSSLRIITLLDDQTVDTDAYLSEYAREFGLEVWVGPR